MENNIFEVGLPIAIETYFKSYLTTHLVGWEPDVCLITGVVQSSGNTPKLKVNDYCKMRFLKDGIAYGFETKIIAISYNPLPLMFTQYPKDVQNYAVRKFDRLKVNLPACLSVLGDRHMMDATITDISAGGCGLLLPIREEDELTSEKIYSITFNAMDSHMQLSCSIRKIRTARDKREVGVEFVNVSPEEQEKIRLFLEGCNNAIASRTDFLLGKIQQQEKLFGGSIREVSMIDILQIFDQLRKDGVIHIEAGKHTGSIAIRDGYILGASAGALKGEDALVELFSLTEGEFHISAKDMPASSMNTPVNFALMEVSRLMDERDSLREHLPGVEDKLQFLKPSDDTEDPEVQTVIASVRGGACSANEIHHATGLSLIRSSLIAARLIKEGALKKAT